MPNVFIQYWSMRVMAYLGSLVALLALWGGWLLWRRTSSSQSRVFLWVAAWAVLTPFLMNTAGWLLTENGRQPWIVQGLMQTKDGVSPSVEHDGRRHQPGRLLRHLHRAGRRRRVPHAALRAPRARARARAEPDDATPDARVPALTY